MYYTYILYSKTFDKTYVGFTSDLAARLIAHNHEKNTSWTRRYQPWELFYFEQFATKTEAMSREKELKSGVGREFIKSLKEGKDS